MKLQEFQAKRVLSLYGLTCPEGRVAITADEAQAMAAEIGAERLIVKAQILAGDRASAGGVRAAGSPAEVGAIARELLGKPLVTPQTGPEGQVVHRVLVEAAIGVARELYLTMAVDGATGTLLLIGSAAGGSAIEQRHRSGAATLETLRFNTRGETLGGDVAGFCARIGLEGQVARDGAETIRRLHQAMIGLDARLIEINPLVVDAAGALTVVDAKIEIDDNALFRHPELAQLRDDDEVDEIELEAQRHQLNFMQMDGDIGLVVNGAGLGLATVDMIFDAGGRPANFMDIRTTAKSLDIAHGVGLVLDNPRAKVLLVNVYGGGMQACDTIIEGLAIAVRRKGRALPTILRLGGKNEDLARLRLDSFKLPIVELADMAQAVERAVAIAHGGM
ncbi:MAG TPA: ATP-grasp domain-containing protein [Alphaproteobacteria bacterium]|nr:ATP-grasp domain-containing protein [Alphaproteobacteria bacterium]